jgi:hypothetical protein
MTGEVALPPPSLGGVRGLLWTVGAAGEVVFAHDFRGRVIETTLPDPGDGSPVFLTEYDNLNRVIETTDSLDNVTSIDFDDANREVTTTLPDPDGAGGASSPVLVQEFDARGLLIVQTDAMDEITSYEHDGAGRRNYASRSRPSKTVRKIVPSPRTNRLARPRLS